ncbi:hypothetical protein SNEBB_010613 [Seison nebaliae]|nr:hypothetical protein SNEBB_010613 [Seison nebaliae]
MTLLSWVSGCEFIDYDELVSFKEATEYCRTLNTYLVQIDPEYSTLYNHWVGTISLRSNTYGNIKSRFTDMCKIADHRNLFKSLTSSTMNSSKTGVRCANFTPSLTFKQRSIHEIDDEILFEFQLEAKNIPVGTLDGNKGKFCADSCINYKLNVCYGFILETTVCLLITYRFETATSNLKDLKLDFLKHEVYMRNDVCFSSSLYTPQNDERNPHLKDYENILFLLRSGNGRGIMGLYDAPSEPLNDLFTTKMQPNHFKSSDADGVKTKKFDKIYLEFYKNHKMVIQLIFGKSYDIAERFSWFNADNLLELQSIYNWEIESLKTSSSFKNIGVKNAKFSIFSYTSVSIKKFYTVFFTGEYSYLLFIFKPPHKPFLGFSDNANRKEVQNLKSADYVVIRGIN